MSDSDILDQIDEAEEAVPSPAPAPDPMAGVEAMFRDVVAKVSAEKDAKIVQLKAALWKIKAAIDKAIEGIDLDVPAAPTIVPPAPPTPHPMSKAAKAASKPEASKYSDRGVDTPLLVDLSEDPVATSLLQQWATGAHHVRYKIADHLASIGREIEGDCLLLRGEASDLDLMAARQVISNCISYTTKENELRMLRGGIEKLFGKF